MIKICSQIIQPKLSIPVTPRDELVFEHLFLDNKLRSAGSIVLTIAHSSDFATVNLEAADLLDIAILLTFFQIISFSF